jgi:rare lipoprotein A
MASFYAEPYHARRTANGEMFDTYKDMTAAHRTLPFGTMVRVTNKVNSESVDVRINDRGPFVHGRVIDLSVAAAEKIDMVRAGVVPVKITILEKGDGQRVRAEPVKSGDSPPVHPLYTVQLGVLTSQQSAENLKTRLVSKFSDVSIVAVSVNDTTIYRVCIGNGISLITARRLASQHRQAKLNPAIIRLD